MRTDLYWIDGPWPGRLAIMPRPRGGDWLEDEISDWRKNGVDVVVSTLGQKEVEELDLKKEKELAEAHGIRFVVFPIVDRGVPASAKSAAELIHQLEGHLAAGKNVVIHCRQGVGRSALLAASVLTLGNVDSDKAFEQIRQVRGCPVPDTQEQRAWTARFARDWLTPARP